MRCLKAVQGWRLTTHTEPKPEMPLRDDFFEDAEDAYAEALWRAQDKAEDWQRRFDEAAVIIFNSVIPSRPTMRGMEDPFGMWAVLKNQENSTESVMGRHAILGEFRRLRPEAGRPIARKASPPRSRPIWTNSNGLYVKLQRLDIRIHSIAHSQESRSPGT